MSRRRMTEGDRAVARLKRSLVQRLGLESVADLSLDPDEVERVELYRSTVDELAELEALWELEKAEGRVWVKGSMGQRVLNPLPGEIRSQRQFADRLLKGFRWEESGTAGMSASDRGRHAANARHNPNLSSVADTVRLRWASGTV